MRAIDNIYSEPEHFDFFFVARWLERAHRQRAEGDASGSDKYAPRIGENGNLATEYLRLRQPPFFAFPSSNCAKAVKNGDALELWVRFLGLTGPQGAMPLTVTEEAYTYQQAGDSTFPAFLDLFNNRFLQLFFRAWANSRPIVHRDRPLEDRFERYVGSVLGLGVDSLRDRDSVPDLLKLGFAGLLAPQSKSASRLRSMLASVFGLKVEIDEFVGMRLVFEGDQVSRLGQGFNQLGSDLLLGAGLYSVQDKIRLRIFARTLDDYEKFLPTGAYARSLADLVYFYLGLEVAWDIELAVPEREAPAVQLGKAGRLGWTTWMKSKQNEADGYRTDARFDLALRFAKS